jgi:hypothetical protein
MIRAPNALAAPTMTGQAQPVYYDANGVWHWGPYAVGGAERTDSFTGMNPEFNAALEQMFANAPPEIREQLRVSSGYRSVERQQQLWEEAIAKYGSPEEARRWVAPPGNSQHNHGNAADLRYLSPEAREWAHANAAAYGLAFPLGNEDWHIELATARGGQAPAGNGTTGGQWTGGTPFDPGSPPPNNPPNALAAQQEALALAQLRQREGYRNALMESLRTPLYTNQLQGVAR